MCFSTSVKFLNLSLHNVHLNCGSFSSTECSDFTSWSISESSYLKYEQWKIGLAKIMTLAKNLQFSYNPADILPKWLAHGLLILVEYQPDWKKIADFLLIEHF